MSKFKLTQTATEVQGILNNSLQKPTGLTKTKLVGVGVNGQENIEIGDNLTLANGKLSSSATGGSNTLYEYDLYFMDNRNLGISRFGKFYSSVNIGSDNRTRTTEQIFQQLIPGGSQYILNVPVFGAIKITEGENTTYYSLIRLEFGGFPIKLFYLDPAKGEVQYSNDVLFTSQWSVTRNTASPRKGNR